MLPGKKYAAIDFLRMAWARKWFIVVPAVLSSAITFAWSYSLPNRYRSETTIQVIPQRVPEKFVRSTISADVSDRLHAISQQILSRTRLERIIQEFNLYEEERKTLIMEDLVEQMRVRDINVNVARPRRRNDDASSFSVSFESSSPRTAMQVTDRLASMFVQENLQDRELLADSTNQFLQAQLEDARRRLVEQEKKLEIFRRQNAGRLPSQMQSNLQLLQSTQVQIHANVEGTNRDRDRLQVLEAAILEAASAGAATPESRPGPENDRAAAPLTAAQQLDGAKRTLRELELRLKPEHPDVRRAKRIIAELEVKAEADALATAVSPDSALAQLNTPATKLSQMRLEAQELRGRLESRKREDARLKQVMASYTGRIDAAPSLESELTELMRDYGTLQEQYTTLLRRSEESKISVNLERRQIGEQFKVIDGARLPERPISPDRVRYNLVGLLGGLAFGLVLVALLEYRDTTLKTDDDVVTSLALPVLAVIPRMITNRERRLMKRRRGLLAISASVASVLLIGLVAWRMELLQAWVR